MHLTYSRGWHGIQFVHILNLSILQGANNFKTACVIPIYKGGNTMIISKYRPVSVQTAVFLDYTSILTYNAQQIVQFYQEA